MYMYLDVRNERPKEGEGEREARRELLVMRDRGGCKERGRIPLTFGSEAASRSKHSTTKHEFGG